MRYPYMRGLAGSLAVFAAVSLAGCGSTDTQSATGFTPKLDTKTECALTFAGGYSNFEALEQQIDKFREFYPKVSITYTTLDDYDHTLGTALASPEAPDLFTAKDWMLTSPEVTDVFDHAENLNDESLGLDLSVIREDLLNEDEDGNIVMIPVFSNTYGMLVNDAIFKKEKLDVPTTRSELETVSAALKQAGYDQPTAGFCGTMGAFEPITMGELYLTASEQPGFAEALNNEDPKSQEGVRAIIDQTLDFVDKSGIDLAFCAEEMEDNYNSVILRFFEGDIPMMFTVADTASGTHKRESQSEAFSKNPFSYSFHPLPIRDDAQYMFTQAAQCFCVNKDGANLDMANEFIRFLLNTQNLNEMAATKGLLTATKDMSADALYASFRNIKSENVISLTANQITDEAVNKVRNAAYSVAIGESSKEEAVAAFA